MYYPVLGQYEQAITTIMYQYVSGQNEPAIMTIMYQYVSGQYEQAIMTIMYQYVLGQYEQAIIKSNSVILKFVYITRDSVGPFIKSQDENQRFIHLDYYSNRTEQNRTIFKKRVHSR
ncbi:hypothetical protein ACF0H5_003831 [Mactra antiquata]